MHCIEKTQTKTNQEVEIWTSDTLEWTPVLSLVLRTYAELVDNKYAMPSVDSLVFGKKHKKTKVIWAQTIDAKPLGGIYYKFKDNMNFAWIILSFTAPEYRGQGVNALCHAYLERECEARGIKRISSSVHVNNQSRMNSAAKVGMRPIFQTMYQRIPD